MSLRLRWPRQVSNDCRCHQRYCVTFANVNDPLAAVLKVSTETFSQVSSDVLNVMLVARVLEVLVDVRLLHDLSVVILLNHVLHDDVFDETSGLAEKHSGVQEVLRLHVVPGVRVYRLPTRVSEV